MPKQVLFNDEDAPPCSTEINVMASGQGHHGPQGPGIIIDKKFGSPTITRTRVTVAKEIELKDPFEKHGGADASRGGRLLRPHDMRSRRDHHCSRRWPRPSCAEGLKERHLRGASLIHMGLRARGITIRGGGGGGQRPEADVRVDQGPEGRYREVATIAASNNDKTITAIWSPRRWRRWASGRRHHRPRVEVRGDRRWTWSRARQVHCDRGTLSLVSSTDPEAHGVRGRGDTLILIYEKRLKREEGTRYCRCWRRVAPRRVN